MNGVSIISFNGKTPVIHDSAFIAPGCRLIGDIVIGPDVSIWYNCVLRGDVHRIEIGARSNVQDGSVIHVDSPTSGNPSGQQTIIGEDVLIGHMALIHGSTLHDRAFVGLGAVVMDATIESGGMIGAGAMLTPGKRIGAGQLWLGRPGKYVRDLAPEEMAAHQAGVAGYVRLGRAHKAAIGEAA